MLWEICRVIQLSPHRERCRARGERPNRGRNFAFKAEWALARKRESKEFQAEGTSGQ